MGYYRAGDSHYYRAGGGFLKRLKKGVGKLAKFTAKAAPLLNLVAPGLGSLVGGAAQVIGRTNSLLNPTAAPSGMPSEGTPPAGATASAQTHNSLSRRDLILALWQRGYITKAKARALLAQGA